MCYVQFYRPAEVDFLLGDPAKAKAKLGWIPRTPFQVPPCHVPHRLTPRQDLVNEMVEEDVKLMKANPEA